MDKIKFNAPDTGEEIEFFVLEQTTIGGSNYILVTEEEEDDGECFILKEVGASEDDVTYEFLEDEDEFLSIGKVFSELFDDADIEF
ncbi:MAG: DUF1292 domain-containing protein [Lachnospiraceae bacterium]|nr:DUF1292 domain-containing protein [Lachnospiraceae bacterium]